MNYFRLILSPVLVLFLSTQEGRAENQCLVSKAEANKTPSAEELSRLDDCVKNRNCRQKDFGLICPWAFERQKNPKPDMTRFEKLMIDSICEDCEQVALISCSLDLQAGLTVLQTMNDIFLSNKYSDKPLIFGYKFPDHRYNNFNLNDNIKKIRSDNDLYKIELKALTERLNRLPSSVTNEATASRNLTAARTLVEAFQRKWDSHYDNVIQLSSFLIKVNTITDDWIAKIDDLTTDSSCASIQKELQKAKLDGNALHQQVKNSTAALDKLYLKKRVDDLRQFTETAIKLAYTKATGSNLEKLEQTIGAVFSLEAEVSRANEWWFRVSSNGLADGQHTRFFMWQTPIRTLSLHLSEGQKFIAEFQKHTKVPQNAVQTAIAAQQRRLDLIKSDIAWLRARGWKGQLESQIATVDEWLSAIGSDGSPCSSALKSFQAKAKRIFDEAQFEKVTEEEFVPTMQICEAI